MDSIDDAAMADAIGDLKYVADGAAVCMGLDMEPVELAIHTANMAKLGPDGKPVVRSDGKCLKPEGWQPPDIASIIFAQAKE
jgi:predicted HAD superfamily Cof-like phosphohydrolase